MGSDEEDRESHPGKHRDVSTDSNVCYGVGVAVAFLFFLSVHTYYQTNADVQELPKQAVRLNGRTRQTGRLSHRCW